MTLKGFLFGFSGRIGRRSYWLGGLAVGCAILGVRVGSNMLLETPLQRAPATLLLIVLFWMACALAAKRWHDRDRSAWWVLLGFVPVIGQIWSLVELGFLQGTPGTNRFGPGTVSADAPAFAPGT